MNAPCPISGNKVTNCKLHIFNFLNTRFHKIDIIKQDNLYLTKALLVLNTYNHLTLTNAFTFFL